MSTGQGGGRLVLRGGRDLNVMKRLRNLSAVAGWDEDKDINKMNQDIIQTGTGRQI